MKIFWSKLKFFLKFSTKTNDNSLHLHSVVENTAYLSLTVNWLTYIKL